ncbi:MAG TPA: hypothetical protein V6D14_21445 [Coleofasciculaceae cyanobacterium]|jgi:hypothetical protein
MKKSKATEALGVAKDIAAIKAALHKRGYRLRKQPKQPVWKVITPQSPPTTKASVDALPLPREAGGVISSARGTGRARQEAGEYYLLTYQPAPISAWVLHPQNNDRDRQTIETIIESALKKQPANLTRTA